MVKTAGTPAERFAAFGLDFASKVGNKLVETQEKQILSLTTDYLTKLKDTPGLPPEVKTLIDKSLMEGDIGNVIFGWLLSIVGSVLALLGSGKPQGRIYEYLSDYVTRSALLDPLTVINAWRRDPANYEKYFEDLRFLGWTDDRIEALKFVTEVIPQAQDIIRFALREVYTPEIAEKYGQFQDIPTGAYDDAAKAGLPKETFDKFWAAHWYLPSTGDGFEMLHRGILTEDELKGLLKANDIMPYWRDQLIKLSWNVPTRVDVRRFWDLRTIDEARLREIYTALGYHGQDLEDYVLWTKIYVDFPALLARYKNGWVTLEDVKAELITMGMSAARADTLIEQKVKKEAPERVAAEKSLTKAEIIKGVKLEVITRDEGIELLQDMGYGIDEATYIMSINLEAATGSPHNFAEFKDLTQSWRLAAGKEGKPMSEDIKSLGAQVVQRQAEVDALQKSIKTEQDKLLTDKVLPAEATARVKALQATLYKAQAELARVRTDYNAKVAEWRHAAK